MESEFITADAIEATEFPDVASRYRVYAVPKTVINSEEYIEGSMQEEFFLERILTALKPASGDKPSRA